MSVWSIPVDEHQDKLEKAIGNPYLFDDWVCKHKDKI